MLMNKIAVNGDNIDITNKQRKCNDNGTYRLMLMQNKNCSYINIFTNSIDWNILRIIWIGFYKNNRNYKCLIGNLAKDIILFIFTFLGNNIVMFDKNGYVTCPKDKNKKFLAL